VDFLDRVAGRTAAGGVTDGQLLKRFAEEGDEDAFGALVRRHGPFVMGVCLRLMRHQQDAEDVFQATFLVLARKASRVAWRACARNWLYAVAYRLAQRARCEVFRRRARESLRPLPELEAPSDTAWRELSAVLDEELLRLPERLREPLLLCYLNGATQDEAARQLCWSLRTLRRRLEQGRELLRQRLIRRGVTLSGALLAATVAPPATAALPAGIVAATSRVALEYATPSGVLAAPASVEVLALADWAIAGLAGGRLKLAVVITVSLAVVAFCTVLFGPAAGQDQPPPPPPGDQKPPIQAPDFAGQTVQAPANLPVAHSRLRLGTLRFRGGSMALSRDGTTLAACGWNDQVHVMNAVTGEEIRQLAAAGEAFRHVAFSPDGRWLAGGSLGGMICLWELSTGKEQNRWRNDRVHGISEVVFSPDSQTLATFNRGAAVHLWRVPAGTELHAFGAGYGFNAVAFAPDGQTLACAANNFVQIFDLAAGRQLRMIMNPKTGARGAFSSAILVACSPDRQTFAVSHEDGTTRIRELASGKELFCLNSGRANGIAYSADGRSLATSGTRVRLWEVASGKERWHSDGGGWQLRFSPDDKTLYANGADYVIRRFDSASGAELSQAIDAQGSITTVAVAPDSQNLVTAGKDFMIRAWSLPDGKFLRAYPRQPGEVERVAYSPDGQLLASHCGRQGTLQLWDTLTTKPVGQIDVGLELFRSAFAFPANRILAAADQQGLVHVWNTTTGKEIRKLGGMAMIAFSADGSHMVIWTERQGLRQQARPAPLVQIWNVIDKRLVGELQPEMPPESSTGSWSGRMVIEALALSSRGTQLAFAARPWNGNPVLVYDVVSGKKIAALQGGPAMVQALAYSPDGKFLAAGDHDGIIWLWDAATSRPLCRFTDHQGPVASLSFSPDHHFLVSGSLDTTALIWDLQAIPR
jgi:RNA polymerase sigma factor (sigma-70 family)